MKCKRCGKEIRNDAKYCPYCGTPTIAMNRQVINRRLILIIIASFLVMSIGSYYAAMHLTNNIQQSTNSYTILDLNDDAEQLIGTYNLNNFKETVTNANTFIEPVEDYFSSIEKEFDISFEKTYQISVYSNNNYVMNVTGNASIGKNETLSIQRIYNRNKATDVIGITITKDKANTFEELTLEDQKDIIQSYIGKKQYKSLMKDFYTKEHTFKKNLGHYGTGAFIKNGSLLIYKSDKLYKSVFSYSQNGNFELVK